LLTVQSFERMRVVGGLEKIGEQTRWMVSSSLCVGTFCVDIVQSA
jgi:hypothetical protein